MHRYHPFMLQDIDELNKLLRITTRPRIKDMLVGEIQKLQNLHTGDQVTQVSSVISGEAAVAAVKPADSLASTVKCETPKAMAVTKSTPQRYYKELTTYGMQVAQRSGIVIVLSSFTMNVLKERFKPHNLCTQLKKYC